ncbi:hypothetical protein [Streptomyces purpurascens]|uniref:hypothetical protein n=1 Tax=Streptomyces purpurascens TaxID=1924 RepID=UPI003C2C3F2D
MRLTLRRSAKASAVLGIGAALALSLPGQAFALTKIGHNVGDLPDVRMRCTSQPQDLDPAGIVCFVPDGDRVYVWDSGADGHRTVAQLQSASTNDPKWWECHDTDGAGNGWSLCNFNMPENMMIHPQAVSREGACGPRQGCTDRNKASSMPIATSTS